MAMTQGQRDLAENNIALAKFLAQKYGKQNMHPDRDDVGMAMEALCRAAISYKPGAVPFSAYAGRVIRNRFYVVEQLAAYVKNGGRAVLDSLESVVCDGDSPLVLGDMIAAPDDVWDAVSGKETERELQKVLNASEYRVICQLMDGVRQAEIARELGVSRAAVWQKVRSAKQKIERSGIL